MNSKPPNVTEAPTRRLPWSVRGAVLLVIVGFVLAWNHFPGAAPSIRGGELSSRGRSADQPDGPGKGKSIRPPTR